MPNADEFLREDTGRLIASLLFQIAMLKAEASALKAENSALRAAAAAASPIANGGGAERVDSHT